MKQKFKLQAVLSLRKQRQEQALLQYARAIHQTAHIQKKHAELLHRLKNYETWDATLFPSQQYIQQLQQLSRLHLSLKSVQQHLAVLKEEEKKKLQQYLDSKKAVAMLEKLEEKFIKHSQQTIWHHDNAINDEWTQSFRKDIL